MRANNQYFTGDDYYLRFGIYLSNLRMVKEHNKANKIFRVELNQFASYTSTEYKALLGFKTNIKPKACN